VTPEERALLEAVARSLVWLLESQGGHVDELRHAIEASEDQHARTMALLGARRARGGQLELGAGPGESAPTVADKRE
jgi:hypothetical protein